jgi:KEOPS complex subunit Pcc1
MSTAAKATIYLKFDTEKQAETLMSALTPEAKAPPTHRSNIQLTKNSACLTLMVEAQDTVALRATLNAYLRWINSTLNVIDVVKKA